MILKHFCHREYKNDQGKIVQSPTVQAAYFHLKLDCARKVVTNMELSDIIIIHDEMKKSLSTGHKETLRKFGLNI